MLRAIRKTAVRIQLTSRNGAAHISAVSTTTIMPSALLNFNSPKFVVELNSVYGMFRIPRNILICQLLCRIYLQFISLLRECSSSTCSFHVESSFLDSYCFSLKVVLLSGDHLKTW